MKLRLFLVKLCFRLARFLEQLPVIILSPDQLVQFSKNKYSKENIVKSWSYPEVLHSGLTPMEQKGIDSIPDRDCPLLLLGVGGGREAIPLARMGFQVTGVDFIDEMVQSALRNARNNELEISGLVRTLTDLNLPENSYHIAWLSSSMYSCTPSRKKRISLLQGLYNALKPNGYLYCEFQFDFLKNFSLKEEFAKRILSVILLGNRHYEAGDMIWANFEFLHRFPSEKSLIDEFETSGFKIISIHFPPNSVKGNAVLQSNKKQTDKTDEPYY